MESDDQFYKYQEVSSKWQLVQESKFLGCGLFVVNHGRHGQDSKSSARNYFLEPKSDRVSGL